MIGRYIARPIARGIARTIARGGDTAAFSLGSLFANGESGLLLSYLPDHLYADVANTVPAVFGGGIASFDDLSGNSVTGPQPVSTARPILGRVPRGGRRNEWTNSDDLTVGVTRVNVTITPDEESGAFRVTATTDTGKRQFYKLFSASRLTQFSLVVKAGSVGEVRLEWNGSAIGNYDLLTGEATGGTARMTSLGDGWWRISTAGVNPAVSTQGWVLRLPASAVIGDYVLVQNPQVEVPITPESPPTPYQEVISDYDITESGVPEVHYARYDLADDVLPHNATLPAITDGTVILIGRQGIWIDEGYSFAGGNWSFGPTTYTNGPVGIIGVVGDMLDLVVLDRPLTADERARVVAYGVKRGSAGLFELGPELVFNGDGSEGLDGWTFSPAGGGESTVTPIPGGFRIDDPEGSNANFLQSDVFPAPGIYLMGWTVMDRSGGAYRLRGPDTVQVLTTSGRRVVEHPSGGPLIVQNTTAAGNTFLEFTNVSVRKLELIP